MRIPEVQVELRKLAHDLSRIAINYGDLELYDHGRKLLELTAELSRRKPVRKAPRKSRTMTPALKAMIRQFTLNHPEMTYQEITNHFGVTLGRASEAVAGKRE